MNPENTHAPEPWQLLDTVGKRKCRPYVTDANGETIMSDDGGSDCFIDPKQFRRIVACVNACAGIPNEILESWLDPPEGQKGAPHGTWAQQLHDVAQDGIRAAKARDELVTALLSLLRHFTKTPSTLADSEARGRAHAAIAAATESEPGTCHGFPLYP